MKRSVLRSDLIGMGGFICFISFYLFLSVLSSFSDELWSKLYEALIGLGGNIFLGKAVFIQTEGGRNKITLTFPASIIACYIYHTNRSITSFVSRWILSDCSLLWIMMCCCMSGSPFWVNLLCLGVINCEMSVLQQILNCRLFCNKFRLMCIQSHLNEHKHVNYIFDQCEI